MSLLGAGSCAGGAAACPPRCTHRGLRTPLQFPPACLPACLQIALGWDEDSRLLAAAGAAGSRGAAEAAEAAATAAAASTSSKTGWKGPFWIHALVQVRPPPSPTVQSRAEELLLLHAAAFGALPPPFLSPWEPLPPIGVKLVHPLPLLPPPAAAATCCRWLPRLLPCRCLSDWWCCLFGMLTSSCGIRRPSSTTKVRGAGLGGWGGGWGGLGGWVGAVGWAGRMGGCGGVGWEDGRAGGSREEDSRVPIATGDSRNCALPPCPWPPLPDSPAGVVAQYLSGAGSPSSSGGGGGGRHPFDLGWHDNMHAVCGGSPACWPLPGRAAAEGDGLSFPTPWGQRGKL